MAKDKNSKAQDKSQSRLTQKHRTARNKHAAAARILRRKREKPQAGAWILRTTDAGTRVDVHPRKLARFLRRHVVTNI